MKKILFFAIYLFMPVFLAWSIYQSNSVKYDSYNVMISMFLGVFSYTWFLWQFVLSARPKFIDRVFGMDKIYRFHGMMAIVAVAFGLMHQQIKESYYGETFMTQLGSIALNLFLASTIIALLFMGSSFLLKVKAFAWVRKVGDKILKFRYEHYKLIHNVTFIAMLFMQFHVLQTSSAKNSFIVFNIYMAYGLTAFGFYIYHKVLKGFLIKDRPYIVKHVIQEASHTVSIYFAPQDGRLPHYKPGQFAFFRFENEALPAGEHPFTISSSSSWKQMMGVTIKGLGDFTKEMHKVKVGDRIFVDMAYGRFSYLFHKNENQIVFIAGGVGITPVLSMLRYMKDMEPERPVLLIWGMRTPEDYIAKEEFDRMLQSMTNLTIVPVYSHAPEHPGEKGYVTHEVIDRLITHHGFKQPHTGYYICGPAPLMDGTIKSLKSMGVDKKRIHFEKFTM